MRLIAEAELLYLESAQAGVHAVGPAARLAAGGQFEDGYRWDEFELLEPGEDAARARLAERGLDVA